MRTVHDMAGTSADPPARPVARGGVLDSNLVQTKLSSVEALRTIASPRKREILRLVWDGERSAGEVHRALGDVTFGAVSQHLRELESAGLVKRRESGRHRYYVADRPALGPLAGYLETLWSSALARLATCAEIEEARRGPRPRSRTRRRR
jgi:DNA-binding transcriptional ArsR family regulator